MKMTMKEILEAFIGKRLTRMTFDNHDNAFEKNEITVGHIEFHTDYVVFCESQETSSWKFISTSTTTAMELADKGEWDERREIGYGTPMSYLFTLKQYNHLTHLRP